MKLQFSEAANVCYKRWKRQAGRDYQELKSMLLECLEDPFNGRGEPHELGGDFSGYWTRSFAKECQFVYIVDGDILRVDAITECPAKDVEVTDDRQHEDAVSLMRRFMDNGKPKLGIFWYDYEQNILFGVQKGDAELYADQGSLSTYPKLHKTYWQKMHQKALHAGDTESVFYNEHDYTQIPRGRVFLDNGVYYVNVGDWINGYVCGQKCIDKDKLRELLIDEFNFPEDFKFRQDVHWDIGHGWSEEAF
ncbi:MAG: type II toxin-antitoxin system YoeB family toxin [Bacteroidales bacterium]|nr:type II toxin-antitoxin system YoeB family toxin [Bacteroidales bacterium]